MIFLEEALSTEEDMHLIKGTPAKHTARCVCSRTLKSQQRNLKTKLSLELEMTLISTT